MKEYEKYCQHCNEVVEPLPAGTCPGCFDMSGLSDSTASVEAVSDQNNPGGRVSVMLDSRGIALGILAVTLCYMVGSLLHWQTGVGRMTDIRIPQHLGAICGFGIAARIVKFRFWLSMLVVFAASFLLTGFYEEVWRRIIWGAGYDWGYHMWTLQFWIVTFAIGLVGRVGSHKS